MRRWRGRVPRFASAAHDATALAAYLMWKSPAVHGVTAPLTRAECDAIVADVAANERPDEAAAEAQGAARLREARGALALHAPPEEVEALVALLQRWIELGDGCAVASHWPPRLSGAAPEHIRQAWERAARLTQHGVRTLEQAHEYRRISPVK